MLDFILAAMSVLCKAKDGESFHVSDVEVWPTMLIGVLVPQLPEELLQL